MASAIAELPPRRTYEPDDVLAFEDGGKAYELNAEGELEERAMGALSSRTGGRLFMALERHGEQESSGVAFPADVPLCCWPDAPRRMRRPDVSFVAADDLADGEIPEGVLRAVPLVVAEVISPRENAAILERKIGEYLEAGVKLVWVIYPKQRRAFVRRPDGTVTLVPADGVLSGEDVLPGFEVALREIIPAARVR